MKNIAIKAISLTILTLGVISCKNEKAKTTEAQPVEEVVAAKTLVAIPSQTIISWDADKIVGGHEGTIHASAGTLEVKGDKLVGGNFILDISTIKCVDLEDAEQNEKLIGHLKSADFFDVATHPNAAFQITSVNEVAGKTTISGNLTIKGIKKNISFPATVSTANGVTTVKSEEFNIDRTEFGLKYNSGKFADAAKLGDYLIKDNVGITVAITAK